jgi:hypothetical protein
MTAATATLRFRFAMGFFILGLLISGITAFPLLTELNLLAKVLGLGDALSTDGHGGLAFWILTVKFGLADMYARYPWIAYGTDWLAFGHIAIALFFIDPMIRPAQSRPALHAGMAACLLVVPLALVCGPIRGIPFAWRLIDSAFGVIGIIPLLYCHGLLRHITPAPAEMTAT